VVGAALTAVVLCEHAGLKHDDLAGEGHGSCYRHGGKMKYPIAIESGTEHTAWGVVVPDLPGCFSAGDTLDEAVANAEEAVAAWLDAALDEGLAVPAAITATGCSRSARVCWLDVGCGAGGPVLAR
jgi:predicted RNase H-like HicB family nuclease